MSVSRPSTATHLNQPNRMLERMDRPTTDYVLHCQPNNGCKTLLLCVSLPRSSTLLMDYCPFYILDTANYFLLLYLFLDVAMNIHVNGINNITCQFRVLIVHPNTAHSFTTHLLCYSSCTYMLHLGYSHHHQLTPTVTRSGPGFGL